MGISEQMAAASPLLSVNTRAVSDGARHPLLSVFPFSPLIFPGMWLAIKVNQLMNTHLPSPSQGGRQDPSPCLP